MGALSPMHLLLILGIAILILGPKRLPEAGEALGRALREFREAVGGEDTKPTTTSAAVVAPAVAPPSAPAAAIPADQSGTDGTPSA